MAGFDLTTLMLPSGDTTARAPQHNFPNIYHQWLNGIASASGTGDHRFESRLGERFLGLLHSNAVACDSICMVTVSFLGEN
jgi:hypothetical protein